MKVDLIRKHIHDAPFVPFRLHLTNGSQFDIEHPDLIMLTPYAVYLSINVSEDGIAEKVVTIGALQITHLEPLPVELPAETASQ